MRTLNRKQVADHLNISISTFERLRRSGKLPEPVKALKQRPLLWDFEAIDAMSQI